MFAFMGASIRLVSIDLNDGMLVFARNLVGLLLILSLVGRGMPQTTAVAVNAG